VTVHWTVWLPEPLVVTSPSAEWVLGLVGLTVAGLPSTVQASESKLASSATTWTTAGEEPALSVRLGAVASTLKV
jgi:hypothetical protein